MADHELKTWPKFFAGLVSGNKTAEVRKNDRDFQPGDILVLREWSFENGYSGEVERRIISRVDRLDALSQDLAGYVLLSFEDPHG